MEIQDEASLIMNLFINEQFTSNTVAEDANINTNTTKIDSNNVEVSEDDDVIILSDIKAKLGSKIYCDKCDVHISSINWVKHTKTYKHSGKKNADKIYCKQCDKYIATQHWTVHIESSTHSGVNLNQTYCRKCEKYINTHNWAIHIKTSRHSGLKASKTYCDKCDRYISSHNWKTHLKSPKHSDII